MDTPTTSYSRWTICDETSPSGKTLFRCAFCGRITPTADKRCKGQNCESMERLARIEQAARAYIAAYDAGDTMAHEQRAALRTALGDAHT